MLHDSGATVIAGDKIISILEARLSRIKHTGAFPYQSIRYVMGAGGINDINEFDVIAVDHLLVGKKPVTEQCIRDLGYRGEIQFIGHHDAHAASAFFCSPFSEAAILIVDGQGSSIHESSYNRTAENTGAYDADAHELQTFYYGSGNRIKSLFCTYSTGTQRHGIGDFYSGITSYLNFGVNHGKVMGLAAYGGKTDWSKKIVVKNCNGHFYAGSTEWAHQPEDVGKLYFNNHPPRSNEPILDDFWPEAAFMAQNNCEYAMVEMARHLHRLTECDQLCIAGGVALNSVANQKIAEQTPFRKIFIQPAASDEGISLGAALYAYHQVASRERFFEMHTAYLGREYRDNEIKAALEEKKHLVHVRPCEDIASETAQLLASGKIVGWFQGGSETGPRALGNRSILADPRSAQLRDYLNVEVKHRETFRPFAPSVLAEYCAEYFNLDSPSPFMLRVAKVKEHVQHQIPGVTHVDGTARVQTVTPHDNPLYYKLIVAFHRLTGVPMVLNTSFNVAGEPMVETPADALNCFLGTQIDALVLHRLLVTKKNS